jgi:hypothetical protein
MATNLPKGTFPAGCRAEDFKCFGPAATKDGEFEGKNLVDLGFFGQDEVDSNKYVHSAVVQEKTTGEWFNYREWGRTGAKNPQFLFVRCSSQAEAQKELIAYCRSKNDKRGEWTTISGLRTLRPKPGKDCYLVRPLSKRSTGLPDARTITQNEPVTSTKTVTAIVKAPRVDQFTMKLMRDLSFGVVEYTRSSMADSALPTLDAIEYGRVILGEAKKRLVVIGGDIYSQSTDKTLIDLTAQLYGKIAKIKKLRIAAEKWILNENNIFSWEQDLDAYESALSANVSEDVNDPFQGLDMTMEYLPETSKIGGFIREHLPQMSNNRHANTGKMRISGVWRIEHLKHESTFKKCVNTISEVRNDEKPLFQTDRLDLSPGQKETYKKTNTCLLVHGTRTANVKGILTERLRLPKARVGVSLSYLMFGPGLYFADDWRKSANYTSLIAGDGAIPGRKSFLFLMDVVLGKMHLAKKPSGFTDAPSGYHSVFGKGGATSARHTSTLENNEFIVYASEQHQPRYLVEFDAPHGRGW